MIKLILVILSVTWQPLGRLHQVYHIYLKGIPFNQYRRILYNNRLEILKQGYMGYFTPYFHKRWNRTAPKDTGLRKPGTKVIYLDSNKAVNE